LRAGQRHFYTRGYRTDDDGRQWPNLWQRIYGPGPDGRAKQLCEPAKRSDGSPARTKKEALHSLRRRREEVAMHRRGVQAFQGPRAEWVLFADLLDAYEKHADVYALKSRPQIRSRCKRLRAYFTGWRALAVTRDALMAYVQKRQANEATPATIN
jgi:hypothetical protein